MSMMDLPAVSLCPACNQPPDPDVDEAEPYHATEQSLLEAVDSGCFICNTAWSLAATEIGNGTLQVADMQFSLTRRYFDRYEVLVTSSGYPPSNLFWSTVFYEKEYFKALQDNECSRQQYQRALGNDASLIKRWMNICRDGGREHAACNHGDKFENTKCPSRILDLGAQGSTAFSVLSITDEDWKSMKKEYNTLSHIPDQNSLIMLTSATEEILIAGFPDSGVDFAVRRAMQITRDMGLRYLWTASLCIQQDSEEETKHYYDDGHICDVYLLSTLNLIDSSAAPTASVRNDPDASIRLVKNVPWSGSAKDYIAVGNNWWQLNAASLPILQRGDIFIHRLLMDKVLYFNHWNGVMLFECRASTCSSAFPSGLNRYGNSIKSSLRKTVGLCLHRRSSEQVTHRRFSDTHYLYHAWVDACEALSALQTACSEPSSAMLDASTPAATSNQSSTLTSRTPNPFLRQIAPFARLFNILYPSSYFCGLFSTQAPYNLTWYIDLDDSPSQEKRLPSHRIISYPPTPSWSWASVAAPHHHVSSVATKNSTSLVRIEQKETPGTSMEEQGSVGLRIQSLIIPCSIQTTVEGWKDDGFSLDGIDMSEHITQLYPDLRPGTDGTRSYSLLPIVYEALVEDYDVCVCLVIEAAEEEHNLIQGERTYSRVGLAVLSFEAAKFVAESFGLHVEHRVSVDEDMYEACVQLLRLI